MLKNTKILIYIYILQNNKKYKKYITKYKKYKNICEKLQNSILKTTKNIKK